MDERGCGGEAQPEGRRGAGRSSRRSRVVRPRVHLRSAARLREAQGNVTRLRNGSLSVADDKTTEVAQKNVVYFKETTGDPLAVIDELRTSPTVVRYRTRFVIVTDYTELLAVDTKTGENLMIPIRDIDQHFTFFLPWAGMEKAQYVSRGARRRQGRRADGQALRRAPRRQPRTARASRTAGTPSTSSSPGCCSASSPRTPGSSTEGQFTNAVGSHTQADGSDVDDFLDRAVPALDTEDPADEARRTWPAFPYVNGRLFTMAPGAVGPDLHQGRARPADRVWERSTGARSTPTSSARCSRRSSTPSERSDLGQHYTSVPNILKMIEPLFLDGLEEQFDAGFDTVKKLEALLERISAIKVFDPACGSGNFLVIAYKELRKLEHAILERLADLDPKHQVLFAESRISIENFYGIEIDDFATEIAILSLWIAKHQMNTEFKEKFNALDPADPAQGDRTDPAGQRDARGLERRSARTTAARST